MCTACPSTAATSGNAATAATLLASFHERAPNKGVEATSSATEVSDTALVACRSVRAVSE
ncbi:hypothetical protein SANT12839_025550 [Streptomyces antimycoticus]|uniref:Uncharacterized protein n=1 Tax=Streptomyces antimycoticus TaxID=68175 RepID=A0A4D4K6Y9_9ACTN|nr:hypothetical protein SANT12839_025550 [Streptomyces antimycoticus]